MIRIHRPARAPEALTQARQWRAARALTSMDAQTSLEGQKAGYDGPGVREALLRAQHRKCAYCERADIPTTSPIDHHRPWKLYPWLAWSWENLLVSCSDCNLSKGHDFPVDGARLESGQWDTSVERAIWVDPTRECPQAHIRFVYEADRPGEPGWVARGTTDRGKLIVKHFNINQYHFDAYKNHIASLEREAARLVAPHVVERWGLLVEARLAQPAAPYRALTRAWIDHHFPESWRQTHGVQLPDLADSSPPPAAEPLFEPDPSIDALPAALGRLVREGRGANDKEARALAAKQLVARGEQVPSIATLLQVTEATVRALLA